MKLWKQLRWRIIGTHLIVVMVGVLALTLMVELVMLRKLSTDVEAYLVGLVQSGAVEQVRLATAGLLSIFHQSILASLVVAALGAIVAGLLTSVFLIREILNPLNQIAQASQLMAAGHYKERVFVPSSEELARVATHFNQMAEALEQVEQQRISLLGNVSHELRTPLTGLEGYLEGLLDGHFASEPAIFESMFREVRRLRRLVNDIQILTRVEAGQITVNVERFDLLPLVKQVVNQLQPQALDHQLTLNLAATQSSIIACADPDRTTQVLINLIDNALRYTPKGGQIEISIMLAENTAIITIQDTGIGIPADDLPYLFERFYRTNLSRSHSKSGRGIGLTISRHLARAMGGELTAASDGAGQGSTFCFSLPIIINLML